MLGVNASEEIRRVVALVIAIAYFLAYPYFQRRVAARHIKNIYPESAANRGVLGEHELEILPDGLLEKTAVGEQKIFWTGIEKIQTEGEYTFVYIGAYLAHVVPKAKVSDGDYGTFFLTLRQRRQGYLADHSISPNSAKLPGGAIGTGMARLVGIVSLSLGLALAALSLWMIERQLMLHGSLVKFALIFCIVAGLLAIFCILTGYRLLFNRPNSYGSLLPPPVWFVVAAFFVLVGLALLAWALYQGLYTRIEPAAMFAFFGWLCWQAGQAAKRRRSVSDNPDFLS